MGGNVLDQFTIEVNLAAVTQAGNILFAVLDHDAPQFLQCSPAWRPLN